MDCSTLEPCYKSINTSAKGHSRLLVQSTYLFRTEFLEPLIKYVDSRTLQSRNYYAGALLLLHVLDLLPEDKAAPAKANLKKTDTIKDFHVQFHSEQIAKQVMQLRMQ